jgi:hypothetical protein
MHCCIDSIILFGALFSDTQKQADHQIKLVELET